MAKVYVGTYAKYNAGNLHGAWLDLEDYADREEFGEAARALHADESDPELMFQDHEGIPAGMIGESGWMREDLWDWLALDEDDRNMWAAYMDNNGNSASLEEAREAFQGTHDSEEDFAQSLADDLGLINDDAGWPNNCIDWERATRELFMGDYFSTRYDGALYVFRNI